MFLTDKASDNGSGIWCSKGTIQRHTGLGESTVQRTIIGSLREGMLIETGRRPCKNGYIVIYRIILERVAALEPAAEPETARQIPLPPTIPIPYINQPTRRSAAAEEEIEDLESEKVLAAFPQERIRDRRSSLRLIASAVKAGGVPDDLARADRAYANKSEGYTRSKLCFLDSWFKMGRREKGLAHVQADRAKAREA